MKKFKLMILALRIKYYLKQAEKTIKLMKEYKEYIDDNADQFKNGKLNSKYLKKYLNLHCKKDRIVEELNLF